MGFEFDESEMYPCDICGEFWPMGEMHELEDGRIVYRNGKKVLILAGKAAPKVLIEDRLADLIGAQTKQGISLDDVIPQNVVCHTVYHGVTQCPQIHPRCNIRSKRYCLVVAILHICNSCLFLAGGTLPNVSDCITR